MLQYTRVKGIYENGNIRFSKRFFEKVKDKSEVIVLIPVNTKKGIEINDFLLKGHYCSVGGDSLVESENFYNE